MSLAKVNGSLFLFKFNYLRKILITQKRYINFENSSKTKSLLGISSKVYFGANTSGFERYKNKINLVLYVSGKYKYRSEF